MEQPKQQQQQQLLVGNTTNNNNTTSNNDKNNCCRSMDNSVVMKTLEKGCGLDASALSAMSSGPLYLVGQHHRRAGSTGTTDESNATDDEDSDPSTSPRPLGGLLQDYGAIATIADKVVVLPRNSSDDSVYSSSSSHEDVVGVVAMGDGCSGRCGGVVSRLRDELQEAQNRIKASDEEVERLARIRQDVEAELEDLTASLFQEAHNMVKDANERAASAEKSVRESKMQIEGLTAEVVALKTLVLTSTPSRPNPHLHPQICPKNRDEPNSSKGHRRSPSHFNLKYGRENSPPDSPKKEAKLTSTVSIGSESVDNVDGLEVDPIVHKEFLSWKEKPTLSPEDPFIHRLYAEDINLCLSFTNDSLGEKVKQAVQNGTIFIEDVVVDKSKSSFPKKCALLEVPRYCHYRMKMGDQDTWHSISQICRNRIIAVCDLLNYLRYIERGLVRSSAHSMYWEIARLRKEATLARLGLLLSTHST